MAPGRARPAGDLPLRASAARTGQRSRPPDLLNQVDSTGFTGRSPGCVGARRRLDPHPAEGDPPAPRPAADHARVVVPARSIGMPPSTARTGPPVGPARRRPRHPPGPRRVAVRADDLDPTAVPAHLQVSFVVEDERGTVVWEGKDLDALQDAASPGSCVGAWPTPGPTSNPGLTTWDVGTVPVEFMPRSRRRLVRATRRSSTLGATGAAGPGRPFADQAEHRRGCVGSRCSAPPPPWEAGPRRAEQRREAARWGTTRTARSRRARRRLAAAVDAIAGGGPAHPRSAEEFTTALLAVRNPCGEARALAVIRAVEPILAAHREIASTSTRRRAPSGIPSSRTSRAQLRELIRPGFRRRRRRGTPAGPAALFWPRCGTGSTGPVGPLATPSSPPRSRPSRMPMPTCSPAFAPLNAHAPTSWQSPG